MRLDHLLSRDNWHLEPQGTRYVGRALALPTLEANVYLAWFEPLTRQDTVSSFQGSGPFRVLRGAGHLENCIVIRAQTDSKIVKILRAHGGCLGAGSR